VLALVALLVAGCGGDGGDEPAGAPTGTTYRSSRSASNGEELERDADRSAEGVEGASVCTLLPAREVRHVIGRPDLRARRNDSLDLSQCRYGHGRAVVRVMLDGAADATRRYFNQLSEAYQKFNTIPSLRPRDVPGVGDDDTYGGVGAFWTRGRLQLVAFHAERIARVMVNVPGQTDAAAKRDAIALTKRLFARLPAARDG
jgi:hypothetical protein